MGKLMKCLSSLLLSLTLFAQQAGYGYTRTISSSGTAIRVNATDLLVRSFVIQAKSTNTGVVYVGGSDVLASSANGIALTAGGSIAFVAVGERKDVNMYNLTNFWVDSTASSDKILVTYAK